MAVLTGNTLADNTLPLKMHWPHNICHITYREHIVIVKEVSKIRQELSRAWPQSLVQILNRIYEWNFSNEIYFCSVIYHFKILKKELISTGRRAGKMVACHQFSADL